MTDESNEVLCNPWRPFGASDQDEDRAYGHLVSALRIFLDKVAAGRPSVQDLSRLTGDLQSWSSTLELTQVAEVDQIFGRRSALEGSAQTLLPPFTISHADRLSLRGVTVFGRYYLGGRGAVHGGAIPLLFDEALGLLANSDGRDIARTATLTTNYRSITPLNVEVTVHAWFVHEEGRKRRLRGELRHGDKLCAEAEGLFVALRPDQG